MFIDKILSEMRDNMNQEIIGKFIADRRKKKNLTQEQLAEKLSISKNAVSKWERGLNMPDISIMQELCSVLNISLNELFNGEKKSSDAGLINYLKEEKRKRKKRLIISIISIILILIISLLLLFFVNNYNKVNGYILSGESENFVYHDDLLILSNIKNINAFGELSIKNSNIKESDIIYISLMYNGKRMLGGTKLSGIAYENNGYDDCFPEEARKHIDKWYIEVTYNQNNEEKKEIIKLIPNKILKNDNLFYKKEQNVSTGEVASKDSNREKREKYLKELTEELINNHGFKSYSAVKLSSGEKVPNFSLMKKIGNRDFKMYTASGWWKTISKGNKDNFEGTIQSKYIGYTDIKGNTYSYDFVEEKFVRCNTRKCNSAPSDIEKIMKEFVEAYKKEFDGLFNLYKNEPLVDEYEDI